MEEDIIQTELLSYQNRETLNVYEDIYARDQIYKDLDLRLIAHPITGNISPLEEVKAIMRALYNLVMTEPREKLFNMEFGTPLGGFLFDLHRLNSLDIEDQVKRSIELFEPRAIVKDVEVDDRPDENAIEITIRFSIANLTPEVFEVRLSRTR
ncbi:hypothetical protein EOM86_11940 [Candidatus Nomurabacteria bacterium]|nr:hypothetical protein [Candidatus Nomurabacteria bacterium]